MQTVPTSMIIKMGLRFFAFNCVSVAVSIRFDYLNSAFVALDKNEIEQMRQTLYRLRSVFPLPEQK